MALLGSCMTFQNYSAAPMALQGSFKNFQTCSATPAGLAGSSRNLRNFTAQQLNPFWQGRGKGRSLGLNSRALPGSGVSPTGCEDCSNAADWRLDSRQRVKRGVRASYNPANNIHSQGFWTPTNENVAPSIWSIRNDLEVPTSIYAQGGQGPPPMLAERFQSVITQLFQHGISAWILASVQRIIRCGGAVDDDMANLIVAQLLYLDAADPNRDIIMYVNSPGGSVTAGMAVFDTMRHIRPDVSTVCVGLAASMGAFLLSGGTKGKRYSLPNSRIMIHQPLGGAQGQQTDIEIQANEILHHKANLNGYLAYHTGQPLEKIVQDTDRDFFMSAKEAKEYGLIDAVISNPLKALQPLPAPVPA